jgi:hypothetical protein
MTALSCVAETIWPEKPKIFIFWTSIKSFTNPRNQVLMLSLLVFVRQLVRATCVCPAPRMDTDRTQVTSPLCQVLA